MSETPQEIYADRKARRSADADRWAALDARLQRVRLGVFAVGVAMAFAVFGADALDFRWLALPTVLFIGLLFWHDRVLGFRARAERATAFFERGIARLEHRFAGNGTSGSEHEPADHAYARDLDLFGEGSLFERMCLARTRGGEEMLASWLLSPAKVEDVIARQEAAIELRDRLDLREDLCLVGDDVRSGLHPETLRRWGEAPPVGFHAAHRVIAVTMAVVTLTTLAAWLLGSLGPAGPVAFAFVGAAQLAFAWRIRRRVQATVKAVDGPTRDLDLLARLLERFEREPASSPHLVRLRQAIETEGLPPSAQISRLHRWVELLDARRNMFFAPLGGLMLWTSQLAMQIESWRIACGTTLGDWIDAVSELEALVSVASTAYENPSHTFPSFSGGSPCFRASELGHPLIPTEDCVTNDLQLDGERQVLIVSGSNMSGKSTLLRSVGVAAVLAQAGAPVCARSLQLSPLAIGASLHVIDSLQEGTSHFYAEIKRVRLVVELAEGELPLLFLLDEIFHGTNSHDRGIGAEAIVKALIERGAIGLVTTHDLALTRVAEAQAPKAANVHFEDHLEDGQIAFDYRMREGVVRKSNAIALMRSVGLPV
ncbi:MAG: DNA mismatch repair protein MutS [bacterium]|nr:DNA mismatch repair protein MutS [bacterium]